MVVPGQRSCVTLAPRAHQLLYANYSQNLCTCADDPLERIEVRRRSVPDALGLVLWLAHRPLLQRAAEARTAHVEKCTLRIVGQWRRLALALRIDRTDGWLSMRLRAGGKMSPASTCRNRTCNGASVDDYKFLCALCPSPIHFQNLRFGLGSLGMPLPTMCKSMDVVLATGAEADAAHAANVPLLARHLLRRERWDAQPAVEPLASKQAS